MQSSRRPLLQMLLLLLLQNQVALVKLKCCRGRPIRAAAADTDSRTDGRTDKIKSSLARGSALADCDQIERLFPLANSIGFDSCFYMGGRLCCNWLALGGPKLGASGQIGQRQLQQQQQQH